MATEFTLTITQEGLGNLERAALKASRRWPTDWPTSGPPPADVADWARKGGIGEVRVILSELGARANQGKPPEGWKGEGSPAHPPEALDG